MNRYTVLWDTVLEQHFTDAWVRSDSDTRNILTEVANWIDSQLSTDPDKKGRVDAQGHDLRILPVPTSDAQVSVVYRVYPEDRRVLIVRLLFRKSSA